jgi:isopentenyl diphosphate isomerase/L-lactate dehydrogenase-like FMN-dependent dehydrogenase
MAGTNTSFSHQDKEYSRPFFFPPLSRRTLDHKKGRKITYKKFSKYSIPFVTATL